MLILPTSVLEQTTGLYTFELIDEANLGINATQLNTLLLTYYDADTLTILNAREDQDVRNGNDVTITTVLTPTLVTTVAWLLQPLDTVILNPRAPMELHIAIFRWTWLGGSRSGAHAVTFGVENLAYTPPTVV
jgi:hypothetical protein